MLQRSDFIWRAASFVLALALAFGLVPAAQADVVIDGITIVDGDVPFVSDNVDVLGTIPIAGAIGAIFRDSYMYVTGLEGLSTFDISNPASPLLTSFTPLPHFENEDVTIGGNLLIIANDQSASVGALYIFDISNPRMPSLRTVFPTGGIIGLDGTPSHTATCLRDCQFAYLAGTDEGIAIVDLRNPDAPRIAGRFLPPITDWATHDVEVDSQGLAWIVGADGTVAYDVTDPLNPILVAQTDAAATTSPLNDFIHHNSTRLDKINAKGKRTPTDVVLITEEDYERPTCQDAGSFQTWKIHGTPSADTPAVLTNLDSWATELDDLTRLEGSAPATVLCSAHWFDVRDGLVAQGWYEQGTRILDVRDPENIKQVGYFVMPRTETWDARWVPTDPNGEIVYTIDLVRGIDILRVHRPEPDQPGKRAPVRKQWLSDGSTTTAPGSEFSSPGETFSWACRIPKVDE